MKYTKQFLITFRDCDSQGRLKMSALVDYMQDIAREHASKLCFAFEEELGKYYWVIIRTKLHLNETPIIDQTIKIETTPEGLDKIYSVRTFKIYNDNNELIGSIIGYYLLMDRNTHRPARIKGATNELKQFDTPYDGETLDKLAVKSESVIAETSRLVYSSDIDINGHMNNAHYIRWTMDMYETRELLDRKVPNIQIQYVKEMLEGDTISLARVLCLDGNEYVVGYNLDKTITHFISKVEF